MDLEFENKWVFGAVTVSLWVLIFTVIQVMLFNGDILSGAIQGFIGGLAYTIAYILFQKYKKQ